MSEDLKNWIIQSETQFAELTELTTTMHRLGYRKMPKRMYQNCLFRMQSEERGNWDGLDLTHTAPANTKNPFAEYGFDNSIMMRSASESVFEEFFDLEDTVELGSVYFNIRTYEIVGFIAEEKLEKEIDVDVIALSVDPHADRYWWITPYAYCNNNPIRIIDPDGRDVIITGSEAAAATSQLQASTNLILTRDEASGKITATGEVKNKMDQQLLDAINSIDVTVHVRAEDSELTSSGKIYDGGAFMGTKLNPDGTVIANQEVNPLKTGAIDFLAHGTITGATMRHEVTEAFETGKISRSENMNLLPAIKGNATYHLFERAHDAATPQPSSAKINVIEINKIANTFRSIRQIFKNEFKPYGR